jgi:phospholipid N-methyltransferase
MSPDALRSRAGSGPPRRARRCPDAWLFFTKFLRHGTAIAALVPSSRWLARAAVGAIDFGRARCIVELGAGTGPITAELLRRAYGRCRTLIVERDSDFCARLRQRFPRADIAHADAGDLDHLLTERQIDCVDHVISGLPLPSFAATDRDRVLGVVSRRLAAGGTFRQLTDMPWIYYRLYQRYFAEVLFRLVPLNFPPGGVYICRRPRLG